MTGKLPDEFMDLSPKRRRKLEETVVQERLDAALWTILLGIKGMNHVHKYGLERMVKLCQVWEKRIKEFYDGGGTVHEGWEMAGDCGDFITDPLEEFSDLSDRRKRKITEYLAQQRIEAQGNAYSIGLDCIREHCGFGEKRLGRLKRQWIEDLRVFWEDRELNQPRLESWLLDIGLFVEGGVLRCWMDKEGKPRKVSESEYE